VKEGQTILLVDDKESNRHTLREVAERHRFRLLMAGDGQEGFDVAREQRPDLVIIRRDCSVLDGLSMSVLMKQSRDTKSIPVTVICSDMSSTDRDLLQDAGCRDCLTEPFTADELLVRLKDWLP
jgi:DNA-binding response OmpR family regulator